MIGHKTKWPEPPELEEILIWRFFSMFSYETKLAAIKDYYAGVRPVDIRKKYGIKSSNILYNWLRKVEKFGITAIKPSHSKTYYSLSFKMEVIKWRTTHEASYLEAANHFKIRCPELIEQWERAYERGELHSRKDGPPMVKKKTHQPKAVKVDYKAKYKEEVEENKLLKARVAYLEKVDALVRKRKSQTERKHK